MREDLHYPMVEAGITCGCNQFGAGCEVGRALVLDIQQKTSLYNRTVKEYTASMDMLMKLHKMVVEANRAYTNHLRDNSRD